MNPLLPSITDSVRLLIVDDHAVVREGLEAMLRRDPLFETILTAASGKEALQRCAADPEKPQVVLLDVRMPEQDGFTVLEVLQREHPQVRVIMLSASATSAEVTLARRLGASGYVSKTTDRQSLVAVIRTVARGGTSFASQAPVQGEALNALSARELEVLRHLGRGMSNSDLGRILGVSEHTIKSHLKAVFGKLGVADRAEAVARAYELGLVPLER
jgi:DNA-binding NarL/FixJ family response regulator